ncbi:hypothetical protein N5V63_26010 [Escherichia coli]|uniref:hypothetical protein n=1 Tax=Escherichia coli TaxID=562 RepID=UPI0021B44E2C|nr:hypothetical protein [Escherichia coli]MCT7438844.1 hypothetical protein [Escherichia coli]
MGQDIEVKVIGGGFNQKGNSGREKSLLGGSVRGGEEKGEESMCEREAVVRGVVDGLRGSGKMKEKQEGILLSIGEMVGRRLGAGKEISNG